MSLENTPLGKSSDYPHHYSPERLFPVRRHDNRRRLGLDDGRWPWFGADVWQAWELSWIQPSGVPTVAWGVFQVPSTSPKIIESKSLKLYLNSLNQETFSTQQELVALLEKDLSRVCGGAVSVQLYCVDRSVGLYGRPADAELIDHEPVEITTSEFNLDALMAGGSTVRERLCSHLLKTNCPVTGQPDWATLAVDYTGPAIDRGGLLRYVVGYRQQQDFHEHCVESIFMDILERCAPEMLTVRAYYTRRGGLDINPWRSTEADEPRHIRLVRQ